MTAEELAALEDLLAAVIEAMGHPALPVTPGHSPLLNQCQTILNEALFKIEDAFCRADWRAYREWARKWSDEFDVVWEACDAWDELEEYQPWIDEPEPEPFESSTWKRLTPEIFDQIGVEASAIYEDGGRWKWEYDAPEGFELLLPLGAERMSGGGFRMYFDTLALAMSFAESYVASYPPQLPTAPKPE